MIEKDLPSWSEGDLSNPSMQLMKLRQLTEAMQTLMGTRNQSGTGLSPGWYTRALSGGSTTVIGGGGTGGTGPSTDLTPPPAPTGIAVNAGLSTIGVVWDAPTYTQGGGNAYTVIHGAKWVPDAPEPNPKPTFANAVQLGSVPGRTSVMFLATEPDTYWCIWAVFVTTAGVSGQPGGGTNGEQAQTGQDPSVLLALLSDSITDSQLDATLKGRINLVDGPDTLPGSVAARLLAEAQDRGTAITEEATIRLNTDTTLAQSVTTLTTTVNNNNTAQTAALQNEATVRQNEDTAEALARQTLAAQVSAAGGENLYTGPYEVQALPGNYGGGGATLKNGAQNVYQLRPGETLTLSAELWQDAASAAAGQVSGLYLYAVQQGGPWSGSAYIESSSLTPVFKSASVVLPATETDIDVIAVGLYHQGGSVNTIGTVYARRIQVERGAVATAYKAAQYAAQALNQAEAAVRSSTDAALSQSINTLSATVGGNAAAIQEVSEATADLEGHVAAKYSVQAQVTAGGRTAVGGFGLMGEVGASGPTITFGVVANQFWVGAPEGTPGINADVLPFVIQTTPTTANGVTLPAGVYMDAAYITNLTTLTARFGTAWIDSAMIANLSAGKITSGALQVGEYIQSTGYVPGVDGFRITGSGSAEFSSIIARGTIYASAGTIGGASIDANGVRSTTLFDGIPGWELDNAQGKVFARLGQIGGTLIEGQRLVTKYGSTMKVEGAPFGTANQFVLWWGPILSDISLCSETNATIQYVKTNGLGYWGGGLSAGVLKNSARSTSTIATAEIEVGPFLTNGNPKTIVVSYEYTWAQAANTGTGTLTGSGGATIVLERSLNGGAWTTLQTFSTPPASGQVEVDGDPTVKDGITWSMAAAITTTDTSGATTNMRLRARITARTLMSVGGNGLTAPSITQSLSVVSTE